MAEQLNRIHIVTSCAGENIFQTVVAAYGSGDSGCLVIDEMLAGKGIIANLEINDGDVIKDQEHCFRVSILEDHFPFSTEGQTYSDYLDLLDYARDNLELTGSRNQKVNIDALQATILRLQQALAIARLGFRDEAQEVNEDVV